MSAGVGLNSYREDKGLYGILKEAKMRECILASFLYAVIKIIFREIYKASYENLKRVHQKSL